MTPVLLPGGTGRQKESHFLRQRTEEADRSQPQRGGGRSGAV